MTRASQEWPADPRGVWAATAALPAPAVDRRPIPTWRSFDDFRTHAVVPRWSGSALTLLLFAILPAVWAWKRDHDGAENVTFTLVVAALAAAMVLGALAWLLWDRYARESYLRRVHRRAVERSFPVHVYATPFHAHDYGDNQSLRTKPTVLLVDARLSDAAAGRLHAAFGTWCQRLAHDPDATRRARDAVGSRRMVALTEIFGPDAAGAWLSAVPLDMRERRAPYALLTLDPKHVEISDVLSLGGALTGSAADWA